MISAKATRALPGTDGAAIRDALFGSFRETARALISWVVASSFKRTVRRGWLTWSVNRGAVLRGGSRAARVHLRCRTATASDAVALGTVRGQNPYHGS